MNKLFLILILSALALSGCGGGGGGETNNGGIENGGGANNSDETGNGGAENNGDDTDPVDIDFEITLEKSVINTEDNSDIFLKITKTNSVDVHLNVTSSNPAVIAEVVGDQLHIRVDDFTRDSTQAVFIDVRGDGIYKEVRVTLNVVNVSAAPHVNYLTNLAMNSQKISSFEEEIAVFEYLMDLAIKVGVILPPDEKLLRDQLAKVLRREAAVIAQTLSTLPDFVSKYVNGGLHEEDLVAAKWDAGEKMKAGALKMMGILNDLNQRIKVTYPYPVHPFTYSEQTGSFSNFVGNVDMGSYVEGKWVFAPQFEYLLDVVPGIDESQNICVN